MSVVARLIERTRRSFAILDQLLLVELQSPYMIDVYDLATRYVQFVWCNLS